MIRDVGVVGGSVTGGNYAGGLVGLSRGAIVNSYASAAVSGSTYSGGLVGFNWNGSITSSYATGKVSGSTHVGGLAGEMANGSITSSYARGFITSSLSKWGGGLIGYMPGGTVVTSAYWDTQASGQATTAGGGTGQTTAQLQGTLPAGFDPAV